MDPLRLTGRPLGGGAKGTQGHLTYTRHFNIVLGLCQTIEIAYAAHEVDIIQNYMVY